MSFIFEIDDYFARKYRKLISLDKKLKAKIDLIFGLLGENPRNPKLYSHKVNTSKFGVCFSSKISGDIRLIWRYKNGELEILELLDIGGHSGKNSVY
jgi:mRNA-degrading endonuclease YafQ of YafQ-DinJ toxin-antitoxin module